jgi:hypothetical protein
MLRFWTYLTQLLDRKRFEFDLVNVIFYHDVFVKVVDLSCDEFR